MRETIYDISKVVMRKSTRVKFVRFMMENYGMSRISIYRKLRSMSFEEWELRGLLHCICEFDGGRDDITDVYEWFDALPKSVYDQPEVMTRRMLFYAYMKPNGLDRDTIKKHMDAHDWTPLQIVGWNNAWQQFLTSSNND